MTPAACQLTTAANLTGRHQSSRVVVAVAERRTSTAQWRQADPVPPSWSPVRYGRHMWSNALAKSTKTVRADSPLSTATCQWCSISTNAYVVDRCLRAPYCRSSKLSPTRSRIHDPTTDSSTLASVAVSEIGRRSDSTALGGVFLAPAQHSPPSTTTAQILRALTHCRWRALGLQDDWRSRVAAS